MVAAQLALRPRGKRRRPDARHRPVSVLHGGRVGVAIVGLTDPGPHEAVLVVVGRVLGGGMASWNALKMAAVAGSHVGTPLARVTGLNRSAAST